MQARRVALFTLLALLAFAGNSVLCRLALRRMTIDPASFTSLRILSGALALFVIEQVRAGRTAHSGNWVSAAALFAYAAAFSFAYLQLTAGTGALLLFAAVQATMILWGLRSRERLYLRQLAGLALAFAGLILLLLPGISTPPLAGSLLMLGAGVAWGVYSLRGKGATDPIAATAGNFLRAAVFAVLLSVLFLTRAKLDLPGALYAILSGAVTSGVGYVIWYAALPELTAITAASVQLSVPVLTAIAGIFFLGESISLRFITAAVAVLGGIALVVVERRNA